MNSLDFMPLLLYFTFLSLEPITRKCTRNLGIKLETGRQEKKTHNWVRKASKWFKPVRWIRTMNHREIINCILTIEFAFNHFVKCWLLFECFESPNSKSLLKNVCGEDKQDCFNIFLGQVYFTYKISVQVFMQDRGTIALWLPKSASAITQQQLF